MSLSDSNPARADPSLRGDTNVRHFACTSCGKCCNRGPEMELSEATLLADKFVTSLLLKVHSLPSNERSQWAADWWETQKSRVPLRPALDEHRRHLKNFASRRVVEKHRERQIFLTISAIVDDDGQGRCPALAGKLCGIYEIRPQTCRTVPLHYSRSPSVLQNYLDDFTNTPVYQCDTSSVAPIILNRNNVVDFKIRESREKAIGLAKADRSWKKHILALMDDAEQAREVGLPTYDAVLTNSDNGYATELPMIVAWRVAKRNNILSVAKLHDLCGKQIRLIEAEIARVPEDRRMIDLIEKLSVYKFELKQDQQ